MQIISKKLRKAKVKKIDIVGGKRLLSIMINKKEYDAFLVDAIYILKNKFVFIIRNKNEKNDSIPYLAFVDKENILKHI